MSIVRRKRVSGLPTRSSNVSRTVRRPLPAAAAIVLLIPSCTGEGGQKAGSASPAATGPQPGSAVAAPDVGTNLRPSHARRTPLSAEPATADEEAIAAEATTALEEYLDVLNQLSLDSTMELSELESVATGDALEWATYTVSTARDQGWTVIGERAFTTIDPTRVELDPAESQGDYPAVHLDACLDSTAVDALDQDGDSALPSARRTRLATHWTVWRIDDTWVVAETGFFGETAEAAPCE